MIRYLIGVIESVCRAGVTLGCIRTSESAMTGINDLHRRDPLVAVIVGPLPEEKNVPTYQITGSYGANSDSTTVASQKSAC